MPNQKPPPEGPDKDAADAAEPLDRFKRLTRRLLGVPREEVAAAQKEHALVKRTRRS